MQNEHNTMHRLQEQLTYYINQCEGLKGRVMILETEVEKLKNQQEEEETPATVQMEHGAGGVRRIPRQRLRSTYKPTKL